MIQRTLRLASLATALAALTFSTAATAQIKIGFMATMSGPAAMLLASIYFANVLKEDSQAKR